MIPLRLQSSGLKTIWPNHINNHGNVYCILIMENCNVNRGLDKKNFGKDNGIPEKLIVIFFLSNVMSHYHTMEMGIITCFKFGYRVQLLEHII